MEYRAIEIFGDESDEMWNYLGNYNRLLGRDK